MQESFSFEKGVYKEYEESKREFLECIFNQEDLRRTYNRKSADWIKYWINEFKGDTQLIERIIDTYKGLLTHTKDYVGVFNAKAEALEGAIDVIEGKDSSYFEELHMYLSGLEKPKGALGEELFEDSLVAIITQKFRGAEVKDPNAEFKIAAVHNRQARHAAIRRVTNQKYLRKVSEQYRGKGDFDFNSDGAIAVENITDQRYLTEIAQDEKTDDWMRHAAVCRLTDKTLLTKFANISDGEAEWHLYDTVNEMHRALSLEWLRDTARHRLAQLKEEE